MKIYTKTGDDGTTGLFFGGRVYKNDIRCEAYGEIDKTVAALGLARSLVNDDLVKELLIQLQNELFTHNWPEKYHLNLNNNQLN